MKYSLSSPLSLDECIQKLQAVNKKNTTVFPKDFSKQIWGKVGADGFSLRLAYGNRNPFAPHFTGAFKSTASGTALEGEFKLLTGAKIGAAIWAAFMILNTCLGTIFAMLFLTPFLALLWEDLPQLGPNYLPLLVTIAVTISCLPVCMIGFALGFPYLFIVIRRGDPPVLLDLLKKLLEAEVHQLDT